MPQVVLPAGGWEPRSYQLPVWRYLEEGGRRAVLVWHRRSGKDEVALHWTACAAMRRPGNYWHCLPLQTQARKALWDAVNPHTGKRRIDEAFPPAIRETTREQEMQIRLISGSTWQVLGSDRYDSLVGSPPVGIVFSEYALADPRAWAYLRPILAENGGWALFVSTPRGRNHLATLYEAALDDPVWHASRLAVTDTGVIAPELLERERLELIRENGQDIGEAMFRQEWLVDFSAPIMGAYYAREMDRAEKENRIGRIPVDPGIACITAWDLGIGDSTAIWIAQQVGMELRLIDYIENSGVGLDWYANALNAKGYSYKEHILPHDGINAVRRVLPRCWFDRERCARGIDALRQYRREWDEERKVFKDRPLHDWTSHACDAMRYLALGVGEVRAPAGRRQPERRGGWMAA